MKKRSSFIEVGALSAQVAIKELESLALKLFMNEDQRLQRNLETQEQIAELIFSKLSGLKGTGLKLLQALSLDEGLLPMPYIRKFEDAYGKVAPLSRPVIKKVIRTELGHDPEEIFSSFNYDCIAAASLGQVHAARLPGGQDVAVKVQYPNVSESIEADLRFIRSVAALIANPLIRNTVNELAANLLEEVDYARERDNIRFFRTLPARDGLVLPDAHDAHCSRKVLTLTLLEGRPAHAVTERHLLSAGFQRVFRFFFSTLRAGRAIHADPHPGNFLLSPARTAVVDFGSVKRDLAPEVVELFMLLLAPGSNRSRIVELYGHLGADISAGTTEFYESYVAGFHALCASLFHKPAHDFSASGDAVAKMRRILFIQSRQDALQNLSPEFTLVHKATQSLLFMLCKYRCQIDTRLDP